MVTTCVSTFILLVLVGSAFSGSVVTTIQHGHDGWVGGEDAMYDTLSGDVGFVDGAYQQIRAGYDGTRDYFTLIAFKDIFGEGVLDENMPVLNAKLRLYLAYNIQIGHNRKLQAYMMTRESPIADHTGSAVNGESSQAYRSYDANTSQVYAYWGNSSQQEAGPVVGVDCGSSPVGEFVLNGETAGTWIEIDVTDAVEAWRTGSNNYGLLLKAVGDSGYIPYLAFASNDYPAGYPMEPQLVVTQEVKIITRFQHGHDGWVGGEDAMYDTLSGDVGFVDGAYQQIRAGYDGTRDYFTLIAFKDIFGEGVMDEHLSVSDAKLRLYLAYNIQIGHNRKLQAYMMTRESPIADHTGSAVNGESSQAYRSYDANTSQVYAYWGNSSQQEAGPVVGVDCGSSPVGEFVLNGETAGTWIEIDVTDAVEAWRTGSNNYGLLLKAVGDSGYIPYLAFASNDYPAGYPMEPELVVTQDVQTRITHGHEVLLENGLQIRACLPGLIGDFDPDLWSDTGFTTLNMMGNIYQNLVPRGFPASPNHLPYTQLIYGPNDSLGASTYTNRMVAVQLEDEQSIIASELPQLAEDVAILQGRFPDSIIYLSQSARYHSDGAGTLVALTPSILDAYTQAVQPDMLWFCDYPFQISGSLAANLTKMYEFLEMYRDAGLAGLTGDGSQPIPVGRYLGTFHEIEDDSSISGRFPSESEANLDQFASWAFGYKSVDAFVYSTGSLTTGVVGMFLEGANQTAIEPAFSQYAELNRQSKNLGLALTHLISTDVQMKMGQHLDGSQNVVTNTLPTGVTAFSSSSLPCINAITVSNLGTKNDGEDGDVIVGTFEVLDHSFVQPCHEGEVYFMVVNGLSDPTGDAEDCQQSIRLDFDFGTTGLNRLLELDRETGHVHEVPLVSDGGSLYHLVITLDGGMGNLYKFHAHNTTPCGSAFMDNVDGLDSICTECE